MRRTPVSSLRGRHLAAVAAALVVIASTAAAHDFWIIPDIFQFDATATLTVNGRQGGGKFPDGAAVPPERVTDARIIGANGASRITELSVEGTSLKIRQKPEAVGQYRIVVGLASRVFRETPAGVVRFLNAEGGAAEAARLERERPFDGLDSVIFTAASYATTITEVGSRGPRVYAKAAGLPLEFVPVSDPSHLHVGDTLHVRMLGNGKPLAGIGIELAVGLDSTAAATATVTRVAFTADANGVVHIPLAKPGPVMLRSAYARHTVGRAAREWDVSRTTFVFNVGPKH